MNCNLIAGFQAGSDGVFQSLIGILMNCNGGATCPLGQSCFVSIPNRDFDELQFENILNVLKY